MILNHLCRFCRAPLDHIFVDLGLTPLANRNLRASEIVGEKKYPLIARVCTTCFLVQVDDSVPPEDIFSDYDYFSSYSDIWVEHTRQYSEAMRARFGLGPASFVVEVASNDGCLLRHFVRAGIPVLGIEPAANVAKVAEENGVPTDIAFFGVATARRLAQRRKADLIAANNVLAHVPDTRDFIGGFAELLAPEGVATFEFPHLVNLIDEVQFDTIYHEHFFYLSLLAVEKILQSAGLRAFDVETLPTHGGSLRVFVCHAAARHRESARLGEMRAREHAKGLDRLERYVDFGARVARVKSSFLTFVAAAKEEGKSLAAYGAAAKGNTFLNYCGIDHSSIAVVYDRNPAKQGKLTPGSHIPIVAPDEIADLKPDYIVILPWNIADEVRAGMSAVRSWGGRFVTAIPDIRIF